ncbi:hypothetical protein [Saccharopolyspora rosea]|uniref:Uncharacterized protein n=1 Tax=Saccharopolyspora rosea TaxID=524884 RepID=A0ABW3FTH5_9PSEU|nr:hypothetical protein [Saccharopolyspora rosea]
MDGNDTLMWEVRAADGRLAELLDWIDATALPFLREQSALRAVDVYRSTEDRAVVIASFHGPPVSLPEPPAELLRRPVHQWPFRRVGGDPR